MILKDVVLPMTHKIFLISDTHTGVKLQHKEGIKKMIKRVKAEPHNYVCHLGDVIEGIEVTDKRFCHESTDPVNALPVKQYAAAADDFFDIRDRWIITLFGNHDRTMKNTGNLLQSIFCKEMDEGFDRDTYGTYSCYLSIKDKTGKMMYKMYLAHGNKSLNNNNPDPGMKLANQQKRLKDHLWKPSKDCFIAACGHNHQLLIRPPFPELVVYDDGEDIQHTYTKPRQVCMIDEDGDIIPHHPDLKWYVSTGSFYKLYGNPKDQYSGYNEKAGYEPNELGYAVVHVKDGVVKDIEKVVI